MCISDIITFEMFELFSRSDSRSKFFQFVRMMIKVSLSRHYCEKGQFKVLEY